LRAWIFLVPNYGPKLVRRRMFAEVDEARLVGMEFESMPAEPFGQLVRFADDFVMAFESFEDAQRVRAVGHKS
jgi:hypothetical protein